MKSAETPYIGLYVKQCGVRVRTAQRHARDGHPNYVAFKASLGARLGVPIASPAKIIAMAPAETVEAVEDSNDVPPVNAPPAVSKPREAWTPEEWAECEAWNGLELATRSRNAALRAKDVLTATAFVRIATDALKAYHAARDKRIQAEIAMGRLKPDRKSTRLNSSHVSESRMPSSA